MTNMVEEVFLVKSENKSILKIAIAKNLYQKNIDQTKIANVLEISQPMVSIYCKKEEKIPENILNMANKISKKILENHNKCFFQTCLLFSNNLIENKYYVAKENEILLDENKEIIDGLSNAFLELKGKNISNLIPEVKINLAIAKENAKKPEDVGSFLNGLIIADDKITGYSGIRFGKSKHLSQLLIYLKEKIHIRAIMNIAYLKNPHKTGLKYSFLTKEYKLNTHIKKVDMLLHKGDFGIEPCTYVIGVNAMDVAKKILKIKEEIK